MSNRSLFRQLRPGDIVVLDSFGSHKGKAECNAIEEAGAEPRFPPPCSPDFHAIEQVFAKLMTLLRRAAPQIDRSYGRASGNPLDRFPASEYRNYIDSSATVSQPNRLAF
jgi:transposase